MSPFAFSKNERLLNRKDFVNLNRLGKRRQAAHFSIIFIENGLGITRLGITAGKHTGNAVGRNRIKRRVREFFRLHKSYLPKGRDIVIVAKKGAATLNFWEIREELLASILDKRLHA